MSLTTRCTECGTVFRVVLDQLKVSDGWVRCGRCAAVFNAQEELLDADLSTAAAAPGARTDNHTDIALADDDSPAKPPREQRSLAAEPSKALDATLQFGNPPIEAHSDTLLPDWHDDPPMSADDAPDVLVSIGANPADRALVVDDALTQIASDAAADHTAKSMATVATAEAAIEAAPGAAAITIDPDEASVVPSFMRTPDPGALWRRPGVRATLMGLTAVLALGLIGQAVYAWRDSLAAEWPELKPALAQACAWAGCQISAPRRVDQLSVEASGLNRIEGAALHRLSLTLRNRGPSPVLVPALDLSLTDAQGKLLVRRVLRPAELGAVPTTLAAGAELPLQALLSTAQLRISGYTVELFYP